MSNTGSRDHIWTYQKRSYWDQRYRQRLVDQREDFDNATTFDWLCTFQDIRATLDKYLSAAAFVLEIGCGNADFAAAVCAAYPQVSLLAIDYSESLFDICGSTLCPSSRTGWAVMDAKALAVRPGVFDCVLDKGCLDALLAGWDQVQVLRGWGRDITAEEEELAAAAVASAKRLLAEVERSLAPGGRYICVSYEGPAGRQHLLGSPAGGSGGHATGAAPSETSGEALSLAQQDGNAAPALPGAEGGIGSRTGGGPPAGSGGLALEHYSLEVNSHNHVYVLRKQLPGEQQWAAVGV